MTQTMKDRLADARIRLAVPPRGAGRATRPGDLLLLYVREPAGLASDGRIAGALDVRQGFPMTRAEARRQMTRRAGLIEGGLPLGG